jgi:WD40 repeat protein
LWTRAAHDRATGHFIVRFDGQRYAVYRRGAGEIPALPQPVGATVICLSPSGQHVAAALDDTAVVWNLNPVAELARLRCDGGELTALALSHTNGRLAARDRLGGLHVWELASQQRVAHATGTATPRVATQSLGELLFSPDDRRLADAWMATPGRIWDLTTMPPTAIEFAERPGDYRVQGFSPDGGLLAIGDLRGAVRLFDTTTGQCRATFVAHPGRVRTVAFTADGQHIWTNGEGALRLWEVNAHAGVRIVRIAGEALHSVDIGPAGDWLCAGGGLGKLYRIDATTLAVNTLDFGNEATVPCTAISPDGRWTAAATYASAVYVWDNQDPGAAPVQLAHGSLVSDVSFSPDSATLATACNDGILRIWRVAGGTLERELPPAGDRIPHLAFDATGQRLAIALRNGALLVWNLDSDTSETWKPPTQKPLRTVCFSPDGRWLLAAGADRIIEIWDTSTRAGRDTGRPHPGDLLPRHQPRRRDDRERRHQRSHSPLAPAAAPTAGRARGAHGAGDDAALRGRWTHARVRVAGRHIARVGPHLLRPTHRRQSGDATAAGRRGTGQSGRARGLAPLGGASARRGAALKRARRRTSEPLQHGWYGHLARSCGGGRPHHPGWRPFRGRGL